MFAATSRLILREQLRGRSSARLLLEIDVGELLAIVVAHHKAGGLFLDGPRLASFLIVPKIASVSAANTSGRFSR
jgi:hypothetical protein